MLGWKLMADVLAICCNRNRYASLC